MKRTDNLKPLDFFLIAIILIAVALAAIKFARIQRSDVPRKMNSTIPAPH